MTALHSASSMTPLAPLTALRSRPAGPPGLRREPSVGAASAPVPLRVVPSRHSPGPLAAVGDLVEPGDPTTGHLLVDTSYSALSPHLRGRPVTVTVDGRRWTCSWGRAVIDLPPGRHHVEVDADGWGPVVEAVPVAAGHVVEVFYRAPVVPGAAGALGPSPQSGVGRGVGLAGLAALTTVAAAVLMLVALVVAVLSG